MKAYEVNYRTYDVEEVFVLKGFQFEGQYKFWETEIDALNELVKVIEVDSKELEIIKEEVLEKIASLNTSAAKNLAET